MILECKNITKKFQDVEVLNGVNLEVKKGEFLTLLGNSGCGKSTLLRILAGLEKSDNGYTKIDNKIVQDDKNFIQPQKRGVAFVFQDYALFPHLSVKENIAFGLKSLEKSEQNKRIDEVCKILNISELLKRHPHELSGGQQQRVAIARALSTKPSILLLDEPFSNLDTNLKQSVSIELRELIKSLQIGVIMVTHNRQEAYSMSDNIAIINNGQIQQCSNPEKIYNEPLTAYVAKFMGDISFLNPTTLQIQAQKNEVIGIRPEDCLFNKVKGLEVKVAQIIFEGNTKLLSLNIKRTNEIIKTRVCSSLEVKIEEDAFIHIEKYRLLKQD